MDATTLRGLSQQILDASKPGEPAFLSLGNHLETAIGLIQRNTVGLQQLASAMDEDGIRAAAAGLRQAAAQVVSLVSDLDREREQLDRLAGTTSGSERAITLLQKTVGEIGLLGMNAKIQLAHISGASAEFANFTNEITRLATLAGEDLKQLENAHDDICRLIDQARRDNAQFSRSHGSELRTIGQHLQNSIALLEERHLQSRNAVDQTFRHSAEIERLVGEAVISLQVNDMTRQRLEHVAQALDKAAELVAEPGEREAMQDGEQLAGLICRLQSIHIMKTNEQFETEVDRLLSNLQTLSSQTDSMLQEQVACGDGDEGANPLLQRLERQLHDASNLYRQISQARAATQQLIEDISVRVDQMTSSVVAVHEIEADIRIMGLNATLRCTRLGNSGRALAVIAQELRQCANRTQDLAQEVGEKLEHLVGEASRLIELGNDHRSTGTAMDVMTGSLDLLRAAQNRFLSQCSPLRQNAEQVSELLGKTAQQTAIRHLLNDPLLKIQRDLEQIAQDCKCDDDDEGHLIQRASSLLDARYTMASERDIHGLFLGNTQYQSSMDTAPSDEGEIDDLLF